MPSIMQLPDDDPPLPSYRATNGFLALCTTYALFALYLIWALLPSSILTAHPFLAWLPDQCVSSLYVAMRSSLMETEHGRQSSRVS